MRGRWGLKGGLPFQKADTPVFAVCVLWPRAQKLTGESWRLLCHRPGAGMRMDPCVGVGGLSKDREDRRSGHRHRRAGLMWAQRRGREIRLQDETFSPGRSCSLSKIRNDVLLEGNMSELLECWV